MSTVCTFDSFSGVTHAAKCTCEEEDLVNFVDDTVTKLMGLRDHAIRTHRDSLGADIDASVTALNGLLSKLVAYRRKCGCSDEECWATDKRFECAGCLTMFDDKHFKRDQLGYGVCESCNETKDVSVFGH